DLPLRVARRLVEIDDRGVEGVGGVERAVIAADDLLIGAGRAERLAGRERLALRDLDASHARLGGGPRCGKQKGDVCEFHRCPPWCSFGETSYTRGTEESTGVAPGIICDVLSVRPRESGDPGP